MYLYSLVRGCIRLHDIGGKRADSRNLTLKIAHELVSFTMFKGSDMVEYGAKLV